MDRFKRNPAENTGQRPHTVFSRINPFRRFEKKPVMGLVIVQGFTYNTDKERWTGGSIYDPKNGKTYDCYAWFEDGDYNNLYIKGYVAGIKALGRKTLWTKTKL